MGVKDTVEHRERPAELVLGVEFREPCLCLVLG